MYFIEKKRSYKDIKTETLKKKKSKLCRSKVSNMLLMYGEKNYMR